MFARGMSAPSSANDTLNALVEIMKDPAASQARLAELQAAQEAANAAVAEAAARRGDLNDAINALNDRATAVESQVAKLVKDSAILDKARDDFAASSASRLSEMDARNRDLNSRENDLAARTAAIEESERATTAVNRQAQADRDAASVLRGSLEDIAASLGTLKAQLVALG